LWGSYRKTGYCKSIAESALPIGGQIGQEKMMSTTAPDLRHVFGASTYDNISVDAKNITIDIYDEREDGDVITQIVVPLSRIEYALEMGSVVESMWLLLNK
jgi:hypothetical protein